MFDQAQNLRNAMNRQSKTKVITVTSGKGGVGKSSFALNLAIGLKRRGKKVLLIDSDFGFSNIDIMLGVSTKHSLSDVISGSKDVSEIVEEGVEGVKFISGGSGIYDLVKMDGLQLNRLILSLKKLDDYADIIIFDTGTGASENILKLIQASHDTILVTTPEPTSITDAYALLKIACQNNEKPNIKLVMNKAGSKNEAVAAMEGFSKVVSSYMGLELEKLGYILRDEKIADSVKIQKPLLVSFPRSNAAMNIKDITDNYLKLKDYDNKGFGILNFFDKLTSVKDIKSGDNGEIYDIKSSG